MSFKDLLTAIGVAKASVGDLDRKIARLRTDAEELTARLPHTDDLIAWLTRAMQAQSEEFQARLERWFFHATQIASRAGVWYEQDATANLLALPRTVPASPQLVPSTGMGHDIADASLLALTHFLMPTIEAQLPAFVAKHFPQADKGIRSADRTAKLAAIDRELQTLTKQRADLVSQLEEARRVTA